MIGDTCACPKSFGCGSAGKHPVEKGWQDSATTDPQWWRKITGPENEDGSLNGSWHPQANVGIALDASTPFALDEDPDSGGDIALQQILDRLGESEGIPETLIVRTGSGGRRFYFTQPEKKIGNPKFKKGLDIKGAWRAAGRPAVHLRQGPLHLCPEARPGPRRRRGCSP